MKIQLMMSFLLSVGLAQGCQQPLLKDRSRLVDAVQRAFNPRNDNELVVHYFDSSALYADKVNIKKAIVETTSKDNNKVGGLIFFSNQQIYKFKDNKWSADPIQSNNIIAAVQDCDFILLDTGGRSSANYSILSILLYQWKKPLVVNVDQICEIDRLKQACPQLSRIVFKTEKSYSFSTKILVGGGILAALAVFLYYCQSVRYN